MLKKLAALGGAAALMATITLPAFAGTVNPCCQPPNHQICCPQVKVTNNNDAYKSGSILSLVNTGNLVKGEVEKAGVKSGSATVGLTALTQVNSSQTFIDPPITGMVTVDNNNDAVKSGNILSAVNTGNLIGGEVEKASVASGKVVAGLDLTTLVNSNITMVGVTPTT